MLLITSRSQQTILCISKHFANKFLQNFDSGQTEDKLTLNWTLRQLGLCQWCGQVIFVRSRVDSGQKSVESESSKTFSSRVTDSSLAITGLCGGTSKTTRGNEFLANYARLHILVSDSYLQDWTFSLLSTEACLYSRRYCCPVVSKLHFANTKGHKEPRGRYGRSDGEAVRTEIYSPLACGIPMPRLIALNH